jgi:hypothetical protein
MQAHFVVKNCELTWSYDTVVKQCHDSFFSFDWLNPIGNISEATNNIILQKIDLS